MNNQEDFSRDRQRRMEVAAFLLLSVALVPALLTALIGGYGLLVWLLE